MPAIASEFRRKTAIPLTCNAAPSTRFPAGLPARIGPFGSRARGPEPVRYCAAGMGRDHETGPPGSRPSRSAAPGPWRHPACRCRASSFLRLQQSERLLQGQVVRRDLLRGPSAAGGHSRTRRSRRLAVDRLRPARPRPPAGEAVPRHRPARRDRAPGRRRRPVPDGDRALARLAAARLPRPAGRAAAQAAAARLRPAPLTHRLRHPARRRGPRAVPPARTDAARQRDRPACAAGRVAPERFSSCIGSGALEPPPFLGPSGHRMGLRQDSNPRVSSALIARLGRTWSHESQHRWNDKRSLVTLTLDDGRLSRAGTLAFAAVSKLIADRTLVREP